MFNFHIFEEKMSRIQKEISEYDNKNNLSQSVSTILIDIYQRNISCEFIAVVC